MQTVLRYVTPLRPETPPAVPLLFPAQARRVGRQNMRERDNFHGSSAGRESSSFVEPRQSQPRFFPFKCPSINRRKTWETVVSPALTFFFNAASWSLPNITLTRIFFTTQIYTLRVDYSMTKNLR